jgi:hypothetical protein
MNEMMKATTRKPIEGFLVSKHKEQQLISSSSEVKIANQEIISTVREFMPEGAF